MEGHTEQQAKIQAFVEDGAVFATMYAGIVHGESRPRPCRLRHR
jgi:hypothetical protein